MSVQIRPAISADIPALVELMHEFHAESDFVLDRISAGTAFSTLLSDDSRGIVWIAIRDGALAGYAILTFRFSMEHGGSDGFIDDLYVRPSYRRKGHGGALLKQLFAECEIRRVHAVRVEVAPDNETAGCLYRRYGLKESGRQTLTVDLARNPLVTFMKKEPNKNDA
jgi:ribosomal protein S18 acetylase RimI-like enzyme